MIGLRKVLVAAAVCSSALAASSATAGVVYWGGVNLTTAPNPNGAGSDGTGVWFNPYTGYAESRGFLFPNPLFEDGKFLLVQNTSFTQTEAEILTEGFFSNGNRVICDSTANPLRLSSGATINGSTGFTYIWGGFSDLGPTFGNWGGGGKGFIPLILGSTTSARYYGYAEINIDPSTYAITLNSFAYENTPFTGITAGAVPEPTGLGLGLVAAGLIARRRRA